MLNTKFESLFFLVISNVLLIPIVHITHTFRNYVHISQGESLTKVGNKSMNYQAKHKCSQFYLYLKSYKLILNSCTIFCNLRRRHVCYTGSCVLLMKLHHWRRKRKLINKILIFKIFTFNRRHRKKQTWHIESWNLY